MQELDFSAIAEVYVDLSFCEALRTVRSLTSIFIASPFSELVAQIQEANGEPYRTALLERLTSELAGLPVPASLRVVDGLAEAARAEKAVPALCALDADGKSVACSALYWSHSAEAAGRRSPSRINQRQIAVLFGLEGPAARALIRPLRFQVPCHRCGQPADATIPNLGGGSSRPESTLRCAACGHVDFQGAKGATPRQARPVLRCACVACQAEVDRALARVEFEAVDLKVKVLDWVQREAERLRRGEVSRGDQLDGRQLLHTDRFRGFCQSLVDGIPAADAASHWDLKVYTYGARTLLVPRWVDGLYRAGMVDLTVAHFEAKDRLHAGPFVYEETRSVSHGLDELLLAARARDAKRVLDILVKDLPLVTTGVTVTARPNRAFQAVVRGLGLRVQRREEAASEDFSARRLVSSVARDHTAAPPGFILLTEAALVNRPAPPILIAVDLIGLVHQVCEHDGKVVTEIVLKQPEQGAPLHTKTVRVTEQFSRVLELLHPARDYPRGEG